MIRVGEPAGTDDQQPLLALIVVLDQADGVEPGVLYGP
jgi:hypothetical protein